MQPTAITLRVPATSANLGAGFDCLGLALDIQASITVTFRPHEVDAAEDVGEHLRTVQAHAGAEAVLPLHQESIQQRCWQ